MKTDSNANASAWPHPECGRDAVKLSTPNAPLTAAAKQPGGPAIISGPVVLSAGDHYFVVCAGRPRSKLTALQFAKCFSVDRSSVYRWIRAGMIPAKYLEPVGTRKLLIQAEAVQDCAARFRALRGLAAG